VRAIVAGGGGFIGSHLCDALLERGDEVIAVDNFVTGRPVNIEHLPGQERFTLIEQDVTDGVLDVDGPVDAVLDLASPASPVDFLRIPLEILAVGSTGTRNLLDLAVAKGARFFLASTSEVYGDPLVHPQPESYLGNVSTTGPRSCYDESKRFSEALTAAYERALGADVRIVRIFNTYGERMRPDDGRVVTNFVVQALRGQPLTVYGDGTQTRSFEHVADEVRGLLAVLDGHITSPVNVGNPVETTMIGLAQIIIELTGSNSTIAAEVIPREREGDPMQRCPDITLISKELGWSPQIKLRDGLSRMIEWFRDHEGIS
jgi:nucleoside-diphosphate-sugar epimerase